MKVQQTPERFYSGGQTYRRTYGQQKLANFGITLMVMGLSFFLYYLGFFGRVDGPLNPAQLGEYLAASGVSRALFITLAVVLALLTLSWNWIFNLACLRLGRRLTCSRVDDRGNICGESVRRQKASAPQRGSQRMQPYPYRCSRGHTQPTAHFHPVKKGTVGHMLWVISAILCLIVFYASYC
jgi:hypothetical protein